MSSKAKLLNMDTQQNINFNEKEIYDIENIVSLHRKLHSRAITLQVEIDKSKEELTQIVDELKFLKEKELSLYKELSEKYDLSETTISQAAANYVMNNGK